MSFPRASNLKKTSQVDTRRTNLNHLALPNRKKPLKLASKTELSQDGRNVRKSEIPI